MGLGSVVFVILLVLKLLGLISISWLWVFSPLLISLALFVAAIAIGLFAGLLD